MSNSQIQVFNENLANLTSSEIHSRFQKCIICLHLNNFSMIFFEKKIRAIESWENGHNQAGWVKAEAKKKGWAGNVIWISKFYVHKFLSIRIKTFFAIGAGLTLIWSPTMGKFNYILMKKKHKKSWKIAVGKFDSWSDPMISMSRLSSLSIIFVDNSPDLNSNYWKKCELSGHLQVLVIKTERKLHRKR